MLNLDISEASSYPSYTFNKVKSLLSLCCHDTETDKSWYPTLELLRAYCDRPKTDKIKTILPDYLSGSIFWLLSSCRSWDRASSQWPRREGSACETLRQVVSQKDPVRPSKNEQVCMNKNDILTEKKRIDCKEIFDCMDKCWGLLGSYQ